MAVETVRLSVGEALVDLRKHWRRYARMDGVLVPPEVRPVVIVGYVKERNKEAVVRVYLPHGYVVVLEYSEVLSRLYARVEYAGDSYCACDCAGY